ncbi:hypothetical protein SANTM175S_07743 [Streptomyces antimycoticus]
MSRTRSPISSWRKPRGHELSSDTAIVPTGPIADVWGADGAAVVERARGLQARALWLEDRDATARADVLSRCALAERLRLDLGATVGVDVPRSARADAVGALRRCVIASASADHSPLIQGEIIVVHTGLTTAP